MNVESRIIGACLLAAVLLQPCLADEQRGNLRIENMRFVQWAQGPRRESSSFIPGERIVAKCDINGITVSSAGGTSLDIRFAWKDPLNRVLISGTGRPVTHNLLRGSITVVVMVNTTPTLKPGTYTLDVIAKDNLSGAAVSSSIPTVFGPPRFAIVNVRLALDKAGKFERPGIFYTRDVAHVLFDVVGFAKKDTICCLSGGLEILEGGSSVMKRDNAFVFKQEIKPPKKDQVSIHYSFLCSRHGKFTVNIRIVDEISKTVVNKSLPLEIRVADALPAP